MGTELVPVQFHKIMQSRSYTVIILKSDEKRFAIYTDPSVGRTIQNHLNEKSRPRPYTHDLIHSIFQGLDVQPIQVVINDIEDTIYFARLYLKQKNTILEIDARPSDCILLSLLHSTPLFCRRDILEKVIHIEE